MAQAQLDDIPLARVQAVDRVPDQLLQVRPFRLDPGGGCLGRHVPRLVERRGGGRGPQPPEAFVTRDRVEPGAELARVAEAAKLGHGDEERILHGVGGIGGFAQHGTAVRVERHRVPIVGLGEPGRITSHDGGDHVTVLHAAYRSSPTASGQQERDNQIAGHEHQVGYLRVLSWRGPCPGRTGPRCPRCGRAATCALCLPRRARTR